jgi:DedD protein
MRYMEKKKLLLVAVSVGVFLAIVIGASILIFNPRSGGMAVSTPRPIPAGTGGTVRVDPPRTQPATVDAAEMVRNADSIQGLQSPPVSPAAVQGQNFRIANEAGRPEAAATETPVERPGENTDALVISVPRPSAAAVPDSSPATPPRPAARTSSSPSSPARPTAAPAAPARAPAAPARTPAAPARPAATAAAKPAPAAPQTAPAVARQPAAAPARPAPVASAASSPKARQDYWVQTGAFSAKIRAERAKETLADKGITSIIDDREVDGKTWYRVRVGPYTSETEARYWLALVQSIDGFDGSQVRSDSR